MEENSFFNFLTLVIFTNLIHFPCKDNPGESHHLLKMWKSTPQTDFRTDYWVGEVWRQIQTSLWNLPPKPFIPAFYRIICQSWGLMISWISSNSPLRRTAYFQTIEDVWENWYPSVIPTRYMMMGCFDTRVVFHTFLIGHQIWSLGLSTKTVVVRP